MTHDGIRGHDGRNVALEFMRRQPLFQDLAASDLATLHELASVRHLQEGEVLLNEGDPGEEMFIVMAGHLEVSRRRAGRDEFLAARSVGDVLGEMALLVGEPRSATITAVADAELLVIDRPAFATLVSRSSTAALTILGTVAARLRSTESMLMRQEKLASLGTMAAGLAHELNNPASAVGRSLGQLRDAWSAWRGATLELAASAWPPDEVERLAALTHRRFDGTPAGSDGPGGTREEELIGWLEERGIEPAWSLAPALADAGWDAHRLERASAPFVEERRSPAVRLLALGEEVHGLLATGESGVHAIGAIVGAVRDYAYLDRAPVQDVDVRKGLDDTLLMLRARLKEGVDVVRDYADDLPTITAYGSELNQVWTNLIGNAIDAMEGRGRLRLHVSRRGDGVRVAVCDDGSGIDPDHLPRIFEPFFTTKPVGSGNGLGLHIAYDIVVRRHGGRMTVTSEPGATCFEVLLPLSFGDGDTEPSGA